MLWQPELWRTLLAHAMASPPLVASPQKPQQPPQQPQQQPPQQPPQQAPQHASTRLAGNRHILLRIGARVTACVTSGAHLAAVALLAVWLT